MVVAACILRPLSFKIFLPSSTLVPSSRTTSGTLSPSSLAAATTPVATTSHFMMPPKMLTKIAFTFGLRIFIFGFFPELEVGLLRADVEHELDRIGHDLRPLEIVLVNTSAGEHYGRPDYVGKGCGMGRAATLYLLERGVRLTGTDAWSWDAPFSYTAHRYARSHDASIIWEGHRAGRTIGYCHIEKLHNLEALPPAGFEVSCFPVKIHAASAGWTRAVAIFTD